MHPLYGSFGPGTKENVVLLTVLNAVTQTRYCHYPALAVLLMEVTANVIVVWSYIYIYIYNPLVLCLSSSEALEITLSLSLYFIYVCNIKTSRCSLQPRRSSRAPSPSS